MNQTISRPALGLASCAFILTMVAAADARPDPLLGNWRAVAMERPSKGKTEVPAGVELYAEFKRGGVFVSLIRDRHGEKRKVGRWKRVGRAGVVTVVEKRTDRMSYQLTGKTLVLTNSQAGGQKLFLERAAATR